MKRKIILIAISLQLILFADGQEMEIVQGEFFMRDNYLILNLPYAIGDDDYYVFDEDTPYAIDVIEIYADGKKLDFSDDIRDIKERTYYSTHETTEGQRNIFISMYWTTSDQGDSFRWNDGRGRLK